jgi:hypothetical protein
LSTFAYQIPYTMLRSHIYLFLFSVIFFLHLSPNQAQNKENVGKQMVILSELTEEQKIEKLILYVEKTEAKFVRNGTEYSGVEAAKHLRMKREKAGKKISTAKQFIDFLASKSSMSGEPYLMKFKNGSSLPVRDILYHQLKKMESAGSVN